LHLARRRDHVSRRCFVAERSPIPHRRTAPATVAVRSAGGIGPMRRALFILLIALLPVADAMAVEPDEILADPALETRARDLSAGLRCLVCQNQSIDDSNAPLARDLRILIRERLKAGSSDAEVKRYVVSRYGDFVLLKPPIKSRTLLLWALPFIVLLSGLLFLWRRGTPAVSSLEAPLTEEERGRLEELTRSRNITKLSPP
jgi:cytochrome c-type biogenesis protein CcmH